MIKPEVIQNNLRRCYEISAQSPDTSSQNGAIVSRMVNNSVSDVSKGYNHFYNGVPPETKDRVIKLQRIEHAERDAIYKAQNTKNAIMFCPWAACHDCARAIIGSGITCLVVHKERQDLTDPRWKPQVDEALGWIKDSGIWIYEYSGPIPNAPNILVSGRLWSPERLCYV